MIQVKVLKFAGETGLRKVGSIYQETDERAMKLFEKGFVALVTEGSVTHNPIDNPIKKEEKVKRETKELKTKRKTK